MFRLAFGLALTLTLASAASADVYRFVDSKGNVQYTDKPALLPAEKLAVQSRATDAAEVDAGAAAERARTTTADAARQQAAAARADQNKANQLTATAKAEQCVKARERNEDRSDFANGFAAPAKGRFSGVYGSQRILNGEPKSPHMGLDIAAPTGTRISAPAPGVVTLVHPDMLLTGQSVIVDHGHGVSSVYIHMSRTDVVLGQVLKAGDPIGAIGMTGRASGPHLHWGLNWFEVKLDPRLLLPE